MARGFSYNGSRAAVVTRGYTGVHTEAGSGVASATELGTATEASPGPEGPPLHLPPPEHEVDDTYRPAAAALWLDYETKHGGPPQRVTFGDTEGSEDLLLHWHRPAHEPQEFAESPRAVAASRAGLMAGRVAVVTGGAQGFGLAIARELALGGASVVLADRNLEAAEQAALELSELPQVGRALAVGCDVADEGSVFRMMEAVIGAFGGLDLFISNAGVLRAGSVLDLSAEDFEIVTAVNYQAFFLCTKHAARALQAQNGAYRALNNARAQAHTQQDLSLPARFATDVIQINSKSGLRGSNRNGAYSGSKFGAIGLVQSFALELVEHGIKVNAICPGNFFDGPLWSDSENGLFVQYLNTGKVPGAKSIADVKRHYESRVPMQRGCTGSDVARAVYYLVEQEYETGQALPVTGGQEMLH